MTPFYTRFPELAARETRCAHVITRGGPLPVGEYAFVEFYCDDPGCECRRALLEVTTPQAPQTALAIINYGWESAAFYTRRLHGDAEAGRQITEACLDPLHPQSRYADHLLDVFRNEFMTDPAYVARLARHYEMFKATQRGPAKSPPAFVPSVVERPPDPPKTVPAILRQLQRVSARADFAPYKAALNAASEQREAITPELIAAVDRVIADPVRYVKDQEDCLHLFAIYLLAQFREPRALDCFLRFFRLPDQLALDLTGDLVTEGGAAVLASVCGGDPAPLLALIHNETVNEFVRGQAIDALVVQAAWGERPRAAVVEDLRRLFHTLPKPGNAYVWAALTGVVCDFKATELAPEARQAFAEQLVDETVLDLAWLEQELSAPGEQGFASFCERNAPMDAISECSLWVCFRDETDDAGLPDEDDEERDAPCPHHPDEPEAGAPPIPFVAPPKVGRNDPCPCGIGKKFKKCCGKN